MPRSQGNATRPRRQRLSGGFAAAPPPGGSFGGGPKERSPSDQISPLRPEAPVLALLIGLPGSGKTSFFRARLAGTHEHVSRDLLRRRGNATRRQHEHVASSLRRGVSVVVDNTNATVEERARWLALGRSLRARLVGYYFEASVPDCLARNRQRPDAQRVPDVAIYVVAARFQTPSLEEGFDELRRVRLRPEGRFEEDPLAPTSRESTDPPDSHTR